MDENQSNNTLNRFKSGDKDAANKLLGKFFDRTVNAAQNRIKDRRLRGTDAEDVAMSAIESLWKKAEQGQFRETDLESVDELWRLLCTLVRFKAEDHLRKENARKRGGGELRGESIFVKGDGEDSPGIGNVEGFQLTPEDLAAFQDEHLHLMEQLEDETLQEVVTLRMEGLKVAEIAARFERSEVWVKRKLAMIRELWQHRVEKFS